MITKLGEEAAVKASAGAKKPFRLWWPWKTVKLVARALFGTPTRAVLFGIPAIVAGYKAYDDDLLDATSDYSDPNNNNYRMDYGTFFDKIVRNN